ncbi:alpha-ketoglutarate-dependent dioxygenase AlkB family protein [Lysobacter yangpyeongensis]|uniref:Alpha-ketoglutarate-dependent dioxygenase AlkB family protein n=1 Tax=Lysobacter yangpyeongensis TaxID=346182 RepID=A0ABW0SIQ5_9GAMM
MRSSIGQHGLFDIGGPRVLVEDVEGGIVYHPGVVSEAMARRWFEALRDEVPWQAQQRPMYDRIVDVPRLTAAYRLAREDLPMPLREAAALLRQRTGQPFNAVGLNHYRDGRDSVAPHNDKLHILVPHHPIALVSLGAPRRMVIRAKRVPRTSIAIDLEPGSLLLMSYDSQLHYEHGVPKTREPVGPRISLAFRVRPDVDRLP